MSKRVLFCISWVMFAVGSNLALAQESDEARPRPENRPERERGLDRRGGPPGRGRGRRPRREQLTVVADFDADGDGTLNTEERAAAREHVKKKRAEAGGSGRGRRPPSAREEGRDEDSREAERVAVGDVDIFPDRALYDPGVLRTLFFELPQDDWEAELADFYRTDVEVPADLTVDGKTLVSVGL
ncbi:MAG: hypothetical protein O7J95_03375, partial [Planctomycetota bacterium]|nr:hypothetical protein [Planctomycetota bacterium]